MVGGLRINTDRAQAGFHVARCLLDTPPRRRPPRRDAAASSPARAASASANVSHYATMPYTILLRAEPPHRNRLRLGRGARKDARDLAPLLLLSSLCRFVKQLIPVAQRIQLLSGRDQKRGVQQLGAPPGPDGSDGNYSLGA
ncbi:hypothetical protein PWT90_02027 [Aphanocladium album]|nr:hypothetical protein PWT90_02027 [Aphanocladium album]